MPSSPRRRNPFFPLTVLFSTVFIVTIFALGAAIFGDPRAPAAILLDHIAGPLLTGEVVGILVTGFLALVVDGRQALVAGEANLSATHEQEHSCRNRTIA